MQLPKLGPDLYKRLAANSYTLNEPIKKASEQAMPTLIST